MKSQRRGSSIFPVLRTGAGEKPQEFAPPKDLAKTQWRPLNTARAKGRHGEWEKVMNPYQRELSDVFHRLEKGFGQRGFEAAVELLDTDLSPAAIETTVRSRLSKTPAQMRDDAYQNEKRAIGDMLGRIERHGPQAYELAIDILDHDRLTLRDIEALATVPGMTSSQVDQFANFRAVAIEAVTRKRESHRPLGEPLDKELMKHGAATAKRLLRGGTPW